MGRALAKYEEFGGKEVSRDLSGMKLFCGNAHPDLGRRVASHLGIALGKLTTTKFADGEIRIMIEESARIPTRCLWFSSLVSRAANLPGIRQSLDFLHPGDVIKLNLLNGSLSSLERRVNDRQTLTVARSPQGEFAAQIVENALDIRQAPLHAEISSSLFRSVNDAGAGDAVAAQLVDVFRYDIDFAQELQPGDTFTVVLEKVYRDGKFLHDGDILAAEFVNNGKTYRAVRYTTPDGHSDYYTPDGKSLRKAFLRAPVEFSRISSGFGLRWHPILNHMRAHKGIDYAAPTGTPIHAAGDGRVTFRGTQSGYGNVIVLAHSGDVQTLYGHMSRFGAGMAVGRHVHQGELIGYVGQSGLATGPHLHYEYRVHGEHRNPAGIKSIPTEPIEAGQRAAFDARAKKLLADLDAARNATHLAAR